MKHCGFAGVVGVARADITPPVGIYCRNWGAARLDVAAGMHRPLTLNALTLQTHAKGQPLLLIEADLGWWGDVNFARDFRRRLLAALELPGERVMFAMTHTHSSPPLTVPEPQWPGGEHLLPFAEKVFAAAVDATRQALAMARPATLEWHAGRCALATNRDLPEGGRIICGYNPEIRADDTLLVGRITGTEGAPLATLVNYACHPTTLAWDNQLVSPDFVGAMRETVERQTGSAPALFLQGASGELSPRYQYVGDPAIADAHGRELGYAVLSTLEAMEPPGHELAYAGVVESGAPLAVWRRRPCAAPTTLAAAVQTADLNLKDWPSAAALRQEYGACPDRALAERLRRKLRIRQGLGDGATLPMEIWAWRIGDAILAGSPVEAYSQHQQQLRSHFPGQAVVWMNLVNGSIGYLPPDSLYDTEVYPVWQTPFARGSAERLTEATQQMVSYLLRGE